MQIFANAKINLGLNVLSRRSDGYHEIESVFLPIDLYDKIKITPSEKDKISTEGIDIPESKTGNLCLQALKLLRKDYKFPFLHIHLHKVIPIGAGLGGGSADAAFVLKAINRQFDLRIETEDLENYAAKLGSDCVFFVQNKSALVKGRGEQVYSHKKYDVLKGYHLLLVKPSVFISTKEAYGNIKPQLPKQRIETIVKQPIVSWEAVLKNDFEFSVFSYHAELKKVKQQLYKAGALYASMSGSGSCFFGVFENQNVDTAAFELHWWKWVKTI